MPIPVQVDTIRRNEGAYRIHGNSGLITLVAAGTASAGHIFAMRWAPTAGQKVVFLVIQRLVAKLRTVVGFTAAQQFGMDLSILRTYTASHSGGTALTPRKKRASFGTSKFGASDIQIATTGALTDGTHAAPEVIARDSYSELAAAATVQAGRQDIVLTNDDLDRYPIVLVANEGLLIRNTVLMGAAGTAELVVEIDAKEVERY